MTMPRITSAEYESAGTIRCAHVWDHFATHVELSHTRAHDPDEHLVLCEECARLAGLLPCQDCLNEQFAVHAGPTLSLLKPIYAPAELINGKCRKHCESCLQGWAEVNGDTKTSGAEMAPISRF